MRNILQCFKFLIYRERPCDSNALFTILIVKTPLVSLISTFTQNVKSKICKCYILYGFCLFLDFGGHVQTMRWPKFPLQIENTDRGHVYNVILLCGCFTSAQFEKSNVEESHQFPLAFELWNKRPQGPQWAIFMIRGRLSSLYLSPSSVLL